MKKHWCKACFHAYTEYREASCPFGLRYKRIVGLYTWLKLEITDKQGEMAGNCINVFWAQIYKAFLGV